MAANWLPSSRKSLFMHFFHCTIHGWTSPDRTTWPFRRGELHRPSANTRSLARSEVVATVSKQMVFSFTDTYGVEIADGEDDVLLLACTVVIDMACHPDSRH